MPVVGLRLTAGAVPVPLNATLCGVPLALSAIDKLALRLPAAVGEKVALTLQLAPTAIVFGLSGQVVPGVKSAGLVPPTVTLLIVSGALPLLVTVTDCDPLLVPTAWLPKARLLALRLTPGTAAAPVPFSATACGLPAALSVIDKVAVRLPVAVGVKVALKVQVPAG